MSTSDDIDTGVSMMIQDIVDSKSKGASMTSEKIDEGKEKFCKYEIKYFEEQSLWLAHTWYYHKDDPKYIVGKYRVWNKCPIEALSELHKSITNHFPSHPAKEQA